MLTTTLGQLLVNDALPEDLRDYNRVLDKKGMTSLLREVAEKHPEKYRDVSHRLSQVGRTASQESGGMAFGLQHMRKSIAATKVRARVKAHMQRILGPDFAGDSKARSDQLVNAVQREMKGQQEDIFNEAQAAGNPLATQVASGTRGNKMNLASLLGSDLLYSDHHDRPIPIPILHSYSEGLSPSEYWAATYGARRGVMATKFATQDAGFLSKQLNQVAHRLLVVDHDYDPVQQQHLRGLPVDVDDSDNEGALLAHPVGPYGKNTVLTPKILKHIERLGTKRILVRSAMVGGSPEGGVYARDVGIRERGTLPGRGEQVGLQAAQALSEPISQGQLSAKHSGGVSGEEKAVSGFAYINQLIQVPKVFKGGAAHSTLDGTVQRIEPAPAGGQFVTIDGKSHYVNEGYDLKVKKGDTVEAGDVISEGLPDPSTITEYKGVGEGRLYYTKAMRSAMKDAGMRVHRRNVELLARGLINHVRLTEEHDDGVPDDLIPYSTLEHTWQPREGHQVLPADQAVGKYLETPVMHYTIGTKIRPSVLQNLKEFGINNVTVHDDPPPFVPEMIRGMSSLHHDPDWMTRMYGSGLKGGFLDAVHRGSTSNELGTSFVPSLARAVDFGRQGLTQPPPPPVITPTPSQVTLPSQAPKPVPKPAEPYSFFGGKFKISGRADKPETTIKLAGYVQTPTGTMSTPPKLNSPKAIPTPGVPVPAPTAGGLSSVKPARGGNPYNGAAQAAVSGSPATAPAAPPPVPKNPFAFRGGYQASPGLLNTSFGVPLAQHMNSAMPGLGGVIGFGSLLDTNAISTLTQGPNRQPSQRAYGAAGYGHSNAPRFAGSPGSAAVPDVPGQSGTPGTPGTEEAAEPDQSGEVNTTQNRTWGGFTQDNGAAIGARAAAAAYTAAKAKQYLSGAKTVDTAADVVNAAKPASWMSRIPGLARGKRILGGVGKGINALGYVYDAANTGNEVYQGRSEEYANSTAESMRNALSGQDGWYGASIPLQALSTVYSPAQNVNLIAQGGIQTANTARETAQGVQQNYQQGQQDVQNYSKSNTLANPLNEDNRTAKTQAEYWSQLKSNPYGLPAAGVDQLMELSKVKGMANSLMQKGLELEDTRLQVFTRQMEPVIRKHALWVEAGQPDNVSWYSPAERSQYEAWNKQINMNAYERETQHTGLGERVMQDVASKPVAIPGAQNFVVPGTGIGWKRFATPSELLSGNISVLPWYRRGGASAKDEGLVPTQ